MSNMNNHDRTGDFIQNIKTPNNHHLPSESCSSKISKKSSVGSKIVMDNLNPRIELPEIVQAVTSDSISEIALDAWEALGEESTIIGSDPSMQYIDTNVGHKTSLSKNQPGPHESTYDVGFECTESIGSMCPSTAEPDGSVTSFSSVYEEIRNCENDVDKIRKLLQLDQRESESQPSWDVNNISFESNSDSSTGRPNSKTNSSFANKKKHGSKISGTLNSKKSSLTNNANKKGSTKQKYFKRSASPSRRKIIVCDGKFGLIGFDELDHRRDKSPYTDDIFFDTKHKPPKGKSYHEVYVTEKEYRLIQSFIPPPQKKNTQIITQEVTECQQTLFGWVAFGATPTPTPPSTPLTTLGKIPLKFCRSRSRLGQFATVSDTNLHHKAVSPIQRPKDTKETQTMKKVVDFEEDLIVTYVIDDQNNQNFITNPQQESLQQNVQDSSTYECTDEEVKGVVEALQLALESTLPTSNKIKLPIHHPPQRLDRTSLETIGRDMCSDVFTASETSVILINTVFKDIVLTSNVSSSISSSPKFNEFITSSNEMDALEKAAEIYTTAAQKIHEYLESARSNHIPNYKNTILNSNSISNRDGIQGIYDDNDNSEEIILSRKITVDSLKLSSPPEGSIPLERQISNLSNVWSFAPELNPKKFQMSLTSRPGILMETIDCNNWQFAISYSGGPEMIHQLGTATREKSDPVFLNPKCLLEMVDRNSSFASGRLTTSKLKMTRVSEKIGNLVQDFLVGKYSKPTTKYTNRLVSKFRRINVFSGVLFQISVTFVSVCKKIQSSIEKSMRLDDVLRCPRLPGLKLILQQNQNNEEIHHIKEWELPTGAKMPMREAIEDLSFCMGEIDSILTCGKNSLASINIGVKIKKSHKNIIKLMCDAVKQLEFCHDIDFGTVVMSLACNAAVIQSLSDVVPTVDIDVRSRILGNLGHLNWGAGEVVKLSKRISLLSSFIAGKSFEKLSKYNQIETARKKRKKQKQNGEFSVSKENRERSTTRKTLERIVEQRKIDDAKRQAELKKQLEKLP